jgi:CheY-like chemotaxis protein
VDRFKSGAACTFKMRPTTTPSASTSKSSSFHSPRINEIPQPDEAQRAALEELKTAVAKAVDLLKAGCPTDLPSTPTGRVEAMRVRLSAMLEAVRTVRAPLAKFYGLLNDEQKARFNAVPSGEDQNEPERRRNRYRDFAALSSQSPNLTVSQISVSVASSAAWATRERRCQSGHQSPSHRCNRERPRAIECRHPIRAGQGKVPAGRPGGAHPPAGAEEACSQQPDGSSIVTKVLYIEDNDDNVCMLKMRLELLGDFEVLAAEDGEKGCEMAATQRPDIILMDLEMPVVDGWEATRRLKSNPQTRDIPVIVLSAHALAGEREKAIAAGCDEFDSTPIEFDRLVATMRRVVAGRK